MDVSNVTGEMVDRLLDYRKFMVEQPVDYDDLVEENGVDVYYKGWLGDLLDELIANKWCNPEYMPEDAKALIEEDALINNASLEEIIGLITFLVRRDRFSAGSFGYDVENGTMLRILNRLERVAGQI